MRSLQIVPITVPVLFALSCSSAPPLRSVVLTQPPQASAAPQSRDEPSQSNVAIAPDIRQACGLTDAEAFFAYNSAKVRGARRRAQEAGPMLR